jgi:TldD protein
MRNVTDRLDAAFAAMDTEDVLGAALQECRDGGATYAAARVHQTKSRYIRVRDRETETAVDHRDLGVGVRVIVDGAWGFASTTAVDPDSALAAARRACGLARMCARLPGPSVELADAPVVTGVFLAGYDIDPFSVPLSEMVGVLEHNAGRFAGGVDHTSATLECALETTAFADMAGSRTVQQRVRINPMYTATVLTRTGFDDMATTLPPTGRGWEYVLDPRWDDQFDSLPGLLSEKVAAPGVEPGRYDLVIDPSNLWLTIHESVGHATEKDRALGYEANYAGTSFATVDQLGHLRYGSPLMNVRADRTVDHGLSTVGWDDEGVAAQEWDLVRAGTFVGYQLDRQMAGPDGRSNGCAYADSASHVPIQRMPNVSLLPDPAGPDTDGLVAGVEDGLYVVGDKSWSIDMQRYNFQFTGQRFYRIRNGRLAGQVRDVAYQANTLQFWNSLAALGGPQTYVLGGAFNCGKGQPGQVAPVSHGCPAAVFEQVNILNTRAEAR